MYLEKKTGWRLTDQGIDKFELLSPYSTTMAMEPSKLVIATKSKIRAN